jgi:multidrug efflux pump
MSTENKDKKSHSVHKEFGLSTLAVNNRKTVFLIFFLIFIAGAAAYLAMPRESFPEIQIPEIYVSTPYPGNAPEVIEEKITDPFEKEINSIKGVDKITSSSIHGFSSIKVEFDFAVSPTEGLRKVKDAVDKARGGKNFPQDLPADPVIVEADISEMPILNINLSGDANADYSVDQLKEYASYLEDRIEALEEINKVDIRGVQEKEMIISLRKHDAESKQVSFQDIENAVTSENLTISSGEIEVDGVRRSLRVEGEFRDAEDLKNVIVKQEKFNIVYLWEVADVEFKDADATSYAREFGNSVVMLDVKKRSGYNLLVAADKVYEILEDAWESKALPSNLLYTTTNDQSDKTRDQVSNLENSIIFGVLLVVFVLLFFLGLRNALFVGVAIPLSMFMAFMILNAMGVTLNVMVLFSLVLALGMLVDNGIVVVENIYRLMDEEKMEPFEAAKKGVGEVALPIIASTATTLAAFVPLAIWPGLMGEFMQYLPITLMIVLGSSLFVALVINPVLTAVYMKVGAPESNVKRTLIVSFGMIALGLLLTFTGSVTMSNLLIIFGVLAIINLFLLTPGTKYFQTKVIPKLENGYSRFLNFAVRRNPRWMLNGTLVLLFLSFALVIAFTPKVEFFPVNEPNYVNIFVEKPIGTSIEETNATALEIEDLIIEKFVKKYEDQVWYRIVDGDTLKTKPLIKSVISQVGEGTSDPNQGMGGAAGGGTPHKARITVSFAEFQHRAINGVEYQTSDLLKELDELIRIKGNFNADVDLVVDKNNEGPPQQAPINIEVRTAGLADYKDLITEAERIQQWLERGEIQGVDNLKVDVESSKPELPIVIDRAAARRYNVSTAQIGSALRTAILGKEISTYKKDGEDYDIRLQFDNAYRNDIDALLDQKITFRDPSNGKVSQVPIRVVVEEPKNEVSYSAVNRKNTERLVTVYSGVKEGFNATEVVAEIKGLMDEYEGLSDGFEFKFTGQQEDMEKEMSFLSGALMIAVFLIFLIIITQFNSFSAPIVILSAVFLSLIGVLLGLVIFQMDFIIIMTMIGIISLAGVVVNNAIVLIDYTNLIMKRKRLEQELGEDGRLPLPSVVDAIIEGGKTRLRPVLLTAITTILGLLPLATGLNINFVTLVSQYDPQIFFGGDNVMFFGPMSWTIIFGLTFATFLTLVIVPVMYYLLIKLKYRIYKDKTPVTAQEDAGVELGKGDAPDGLTPELG